MTDVEEDIAAEMARATGPSRAADEEAAEGGGQAEGEEGPPTAKAKPKKAAADEGEAKPKRKRVTKKKATRRHPTTTTTSRSTWAPRSTARPGTNRSSTSTRWARTTGSADGPEPEARPDREATDEPRGGADRAGRRTSTPSRSRSRRTSRRIDTGLRSNNDADYEDDYAPRRGGRGAIAATGAGTAAAAATATGVRDRGGPRAAARRPRPGGGGGGGFGRGRDGGMRPPPIETIFKRGQEVIVQVIKEGMGTKGPTLSTHISIAGRYLVLAPWLNRVAVSRKIDGRGHPAAAQGDHGAN